jgi:serine/threonine protein kinase
MGEVYLAEDIRLGHQVAIKKLPRHLTSDQAHRLRFEREARAVAKLRHPYIVPLYEYDEVDGELYLVTEYLPGGSLRDVLRENCGPLPFESVLRWGVQAAEGLAEAHAEGILHRDIKPDNLLLSEKGDLRIADFGLAHLDTETRITQTGAVMGTLGYLSPEQVRGEQAGQSSDLFALGATLYELLTGKPAFTGDNHAALMHAILSREPQSPASLNPAMPDEMSELVTELLDKNPDRRPRSAEELARRLRAVADRCDLGKTMPLVASGSPRRTPRGLVLTATLSLVIAIGVGSWALLRPGSDSHDASSVNRIAVLPFTTRGGEDWASRGIADLLSSKLDGAGDLQTVDAHALFARTRDLNPESVGPSEAFSIAEDLEAGFFILGNAMQAGNRLHVAASMFGRGASSEPVARAEAEGTPEDLLDLANRIAIDLLKEYMGEALRGRIDRESIDTESYPALKAFLQGEQLWRLQQATNSTPFYEQAVAEDPEFALAWLRLAIVHGWKPTNVKDADTNRAREEALDRALELRDRLSPRHQLWLDAYAAQVAEDFDRSVQLFSELLARYPDDVEAWDRLGAIKIIYNAWRHGQSVVIGKSDLERALELDPDYSHANFHMNFVRAVEQDGDLEGDGPFAVFSREDPMRQREIYEMGRDGPDNLLSWTEGFAIISKNFEAAERTTELRTDLKRHPETRGVGYIVLAMLAAAQGEWNRARSYFESADEFTPDLSLQYRALIAGHPFLDVSSDELHEIHARVETWDPDSVPAPTSTWRHLTVHEYIRPQIKEYLLGLLSVRLGELERARQHAEALESMGPGPREQRLAVDQSHSIHAQVLWAQGDLSAALDRFERAEIKAGYEEFQYSLFFFQSLDRYLRAELLLEMGREDEAMNWFGSFAWILSQEFVYQPHSNLRRAQILDRKGEVSEAIKRYRRFMENWNESDASLRLLHELAQSRVHALESTTVNR